MANTIKELVENQLARNRNVGQEHKDNNEPCIELTVNLITGAVQGAVNDALRDNSGYHSNEIVTTSIYIDVFSKKHSLRLTVSGDYLLKMLGVVVGHKSGKTAHGVFYVVLRGVVSILNTESIELRYELSVPGYDPDWFEVEELIKNCAFTIFVEDAKFKDKIDTHGFFKAFKHFYL